MSPQHRHPFRPDHRVPISKFMLTLAAVATFVCLTASTVASADEPVVKIQEDWKVELNVPDPDDQSPQIITTVSPNGSLDDLYAVFEVNHATLPEYDAGGMQLQAWSGETNLALHNSRRSQLLARNDELITYTVSISIENGYMKFEILNGHSTTWSDFGKGYFYLAIPTTTDNLDSYNPDTSIAKSRIGFASHRVKKFSRIAVRKYSAAGLVSTDSTERVVHQHESNE